MIEISGVWEEEDEEFLKSHLRRERERERDD